MANVHRHSAPRQDFDSYGSQLSVFKVQIDCCKDCPKKLKKRLEGLKGIESVVVDDIRNVTTVKGNFDSREIIDKLASLGKKAELVHERNKTNSYRVELPEDDEEEDIDSSHDTFRHKDSSVRHKNSSFRHRNSPNRHSDPSNHSRDRGSAYSGREFPAHVCRDIYCTQHKREDDMPPKTNNNDNTNNNGLPMFPELPMFPGGHDYGYPYFPPPYGPPPPPLTPPASFGQYYGPGSMPPEYGHFGHRKRCNIM